MLKNISKENIILKLGGVEVIITPGQMIEVDKVFSFSCPKVAIEDRFINKFIGKIEKGEFLSPKEETKKEIKQEPKKEEKPKKKAKR